MIGRRDFLSIGLGAASLSGRSSAAGGERNVLFLAVDDLRPELGCYGNRVVRSPNVDRLASRSLLFRRAYCQSPVCGPSRASLLTGLRPDTTRVWGNKRHLRDSLSDVVTLPQRFKQAGYHTQSFGKVMHGRQTDPPSWSSPAWPLDGMQAGMQYVDEAGLEDLRTKASDRPLQGPEVPTLEWKKRNSWQAPEVPDNALQDGQVADRAVEALRGLKNERFFLAVGFQKPHLPFTAPKKYFDLYDDADLPVPQDLQRPVDAPDTAFTRWQELRGYTDIPREGPLPAGKARELIHGYYAATSYMDAQAGRILDELENLGLADRTVVVLFGDHGWHLGEQDLWAKTTNFELAARVPLMVHVPGMQAQGRASDGLVELVDLYPTLCEACGVSAPEDLEGLSMLPLLEEPGRDWKLAAFNQIPRPYLASQDWERMGYSMRTDRYRYTEWVDEAHSVVSRELYDLQASPTETVNLANRADRSRLVEELGAQLDAGWRSALPEAAR